MQVETIETILASLKSLSDIWPEIDKIDISGDIKQELVSKYPSILKLINKILSVKLETKNRTVDQILFDIMEKKMKINSKIMNIIKESSVDCIDNTKDEPIINNKCLRFSEKLQDEDFKKHCYDLICEKVILKYEKNFGIDDVTIEEEISE